jgi:hypothetical protein
MPDSAIPDLSKYDHFRTLIRLTPHHEPRDLQIPSKYCVHGIPAGHMNLFWSLLQRHIQKFDRFSKRLPTMALACWDKIAFILVEQLAVLSCKHFYLTLQDNTALVKRMDMTGIFLFRTYYLHTHHDEVIPYSHLSQNTRQELFQLHNGQIVKSHITSFLLSGMLMWKSNSESRHFSFDIHACTYDQASRIPA